MLFRSEELPRLRRERQTGDGVGRFRRVAAQEARQLRAEQREERDPLGAPGARVGEHERVDAGDQPVGGGRRRCKVVAASGDVSDIEPGMPPDQALELARRGEVEISVLRPAADAARATSSAIRCLS